VGVNTARFAPSIMTPTVRMGLGPSAMLNYRAHRGGSKPPPYGWARVPAQQGIRLSTLFAVGTRIRVGEVFGTGNRSLVGAVPPYLPKITMGPQ